MSDEIARPEDDDYDLLTFGEAGLRLQNEIQKVRKELALAEQEIGGGAPGRSSGAAELRSRLRDLLDAQRRNSPQQLDGQAFYDFFGYHAGNARLPD